MSGLGQFRGRIAVLGSVIVILLAGGSWLALSHASAQSTHSSASQGKQGQAKPATPLSIVSVTPATQSKGADGTAPIRVTFSAPLAADSPLPTVKPAIAGNWVPAGKNTIKFKPARGFSQRTHVRVLIPAGQAGVRSAGGGLLAQPQTVRFRTGGYASARLPELLAQLGYLPLTWTASAGATAPRPGSATGQLSAAYTAPEGSFTWQPGYPAALHAFWDAGSPSGLIVHGAVMAFQSDHGLVMDGIAGSQVWKALLKAASKDEENQHGYTYALASQHSPESLTVWHDGKVILETAANTGIPAAPTAVGTAPVYLRYQSQIMRGKNPDGTKYADQVYWVAYFRAGEAVHYFPRGSYGYQQSLGCVELPYAQAKSVWPYLTYGTLVTVTPA